MAAKPSEAVEKPNHAETKSDICSTPIDRSAPAGSKSSLGAKSDCNGRPTADDSVVEAKDEQSPSLSPALPDREARR